MLNILDDLSHARLTVAMGQREASRSRALTVLASFRRDVKSPRSLLAQDSLGRVRGHPSKVRTWE